MVGQALQGKGEMDNNRAVVPSSKSGADPRDRLVTSGLQVRQRTLAYKKGHSRTTNLPMSEEEEVISGSLA